MRNPQKSKPSPEPSRSGIDKSRRLHKGRQVNLPLLGASAAVVVVLAVAGYFWYGRQTGRLSGAMKQRAEALAAEEKWRDAASYWQRYLWLEPNDFDARMQLVDAMGQSIVAPRERRRFSVLLHETIGLASGHPAAQAELQARVAENQLEMGAFSEAYAAARELLGPRSGSAWAAAHPDEAAQVLRVRALAGSVLARDQGEVAPPDVANDLAAAIAALPDDLRLASTAATFFRQYAASLGEDAAKRADAFIDGYVSQHPDDADGRVTRYVYRVRNGLPDAEADLSEALRIKPDHYDALVYRAGVLASTSPAEAQAALERAIESLPRANRAYLALAQLHLAAGRTDEAVATLRRGAESIGPGDVALEAMLAHALVKAGQLTAADEALRHLDRTVQARLGDLTTQGRQQLRDQLQLLRAQREIAGGNLGAAVVPLRAIVAAAKESGAALTREVVEARLLLASLMERLGYWDLAAAYWMDMAVVPELAGEATRRAATAYLAAGQYDRAIERLDAYFHPPVGAAGAPAWQPAPEAWVVAVQAHLQKQLAATADQRNWSEFEVALARAKTLDPPQLPVVFAEFDYWSSLGNDESPAKARQTLADGEAAFGESPEFWRAAAAGYQRLGLADDVERALARFDAVESSPVRRATVRALLAARSGDFAAADEVLQSASAAATDADRAELAATRVRLALSGGDPRQALDAARALVEANATNPRALITGIEAALTARNFDLAREWEGRLAAVSPADDFTLQSLRVRRLLDQFADLPASERQEAGRLAAALRSSRPNSGEVAALNARYAELTGARAQAIDGYQRALLLGHRGPAVQLRLAGLLFADGRYEESERLLGQLAASGHASQEIDSLSIAAALQQDHLAEALRLAADAAQKNPNDVLRQIWHANLLAHADQVDEAELAFRAALERFPGDVRVWSGLFLLYQRANRLDEARTLLDDMAAAVSDGPDRRRVAAQAYQMLGDNQRAAQEAEAAVRLEPASVPSRLLLAKLLTAVDVSRARKEYEEILAKYDSSNAEARLQLAVLLSATGGEEDRRRALQLLEAAGRPGAPDALAATRLRAALISDQGRTRQEREAQVTEARKILEEQVQARGAAADDVDRLLLAKLYEKEAWLRLDLPLLQAAREQLRQLAGRDGAPVNYTVEYTDFLLRQLAHSGELNVDADEQLRRERQDAWATMREVFLEDAKSRIAELEQKAQQPGSTIDAFALVSCRVRLLHATDQPEAVAAEMARIEQELLPATENEFGKARAWVAMANLYSSMGAHADAERWYRRLADISPETFVLVVRELAAQGRGQEAIDACLQAAAQGRVQSQNVAAVLAQLLSSDLVDAEAAGQAEPVIAKALEMHEDDVNLLMAVAVLNVTRDNTDEAIKHFRRVLELEPTNALAANNLATLLAEQPSRRAEALELMQNALAANGRQPALLDTLGTIQLRSGQYAQAIASLEEAVAGGGGDPRYYFHLAAAYLRAERPEEAQAKLAHARRLGLDKTILTAGDQELLRELDERLSGARSETRSAPRFPQQTTYRTLARAG